ncbi:hypothetical protein QL285_087146 [Trifolium repens]|nr:hypothetical protein QL285_087146 [Trifolium repens]
MQINLILDTERKRERERERERLREMRRRRVALKLAFGGGWCEGGGCRRHDVKIKQKWESENPNFLTLHRHSSQSYRIDKRYPTRVLKGTTSTSQNEIRIGCSHIIRIDLAFRS